MARTFADRWVLVAGCGYVGSVLASELVASGARVLGLRRSAVDPASVGYVPVAADLADRRALEAALPGPIAAVAYLAGAEGRTEDAYRRAYVGGLVTLLELLRDRGDPLERLVFASSTAVYGGADGAWVDETSPTEPDDFSGRVLLEAEQVALAAPCDAVVVRFAGIYGPGRTRPIREVASGRATLDPQPSFTNRIHRDDCAGLVAHLLANGSPHRVLVGVDREPADRADVLRWLAERLGVPAPPIDPSRPRTRGHKRCRGERLLETGYVLRYPSFREGYLPLLGEAT